MAGLADTIAQLRQRSSPQAVIDSPLVALDAFGSNPGALRGHCYAPSGGASTALVVVLHGCTQTAAGYDHGAGWSALAADHGFAVLLPEQQRQNNANLCFNWFEPGDIRRDEGEALSIRQMIAAMCTRYPIDSARIYVTGLSAGGAMACAMLALYPDLFAGGAVIAGLPFGTAHGVPQALERMRGRGLPDAETLARLAERGSANDGPWPTLAVWHGESDRTVVPANATAIVDQWRHLHGVGPNPDRIEQIDGATRRVWLDDSGRVAIEDYRVKGFGHGTPLATAGDDACGVAGPHMMEAGISSTRHIARGWGLVGARVARGAPAPVVQTAAPARNATRMPPPPAAATNPGAVIERALRAAGLMR